MRKRLMELIAESAIKGDYTYIPDVADHLIANGVTINEWISVEERLPETTDKMLVYDSEGNVYTGTYMRGCRGGTWITSVMGGGPITHWMPLPEPPKMKGE